MMTALSWIFSAVIVFSVFLIGNKNRWGWMVANVGALGFIYLYIQTKLWGGIALDLFLLVMNTRNFIKWTYTERVHKVPSIVYFKFAPSFPFKKGEVIMDSSRHRYIVLKQNCKQTWWRKLWKMSNIEGHTKVKRLPL